MIPGHSLFKTEIKKLKFETDAGIRFPCTALIQFKVEDRENPLVELMGYMDEEEVYKAIDRGDDLNLDNCYIEKFSLKDYRLTRNLGARDRIVLKGFTAKNSLFGGFASLDFSHAVFEGEEFSLESAWISRGDIIFESASVTFKNCRFGEGKISFYRSRFNSLSLNFCHLNGFVDLRVTQCHSIDLSSTIVRDIIDFYPHEFVARVQVISLAGMRLIGRIYVDWKQNSLKRLIYAQEKSSLWVKAEQFRILKENFKNLGHYNDEDRAYVEFKRNESRADLAESLDKSRLNGIFQYPLYWFKLGLFDKAGLYATSPFRVLITMLTCFVVFSFTYYLLILNSSADIIASVDDPLTVLARSFYHSAITFLTIGYGDHYPFGSIRWVSSLEGFFGLFLMSYFTVAFVRKVLR